VAYVADNKSAKRYEVMCRLNKAISDGDLKDINILRVALETVPYTEDDDD
jgi:hypothetical protein